MSTTVYITTITFLLIIIIFLIVVIVLLRRRIKKIHKTMPMKNIKTVKMPMKNIKATDTEEEHYGNEEYIYYDSIKPASSTVL